MRRFTIAVEIQSEEDVFRVRSALTKVSNVLSKLPDLDYVHIKLCAYDEYGGGAREFCQALHSAAIHMHERAAVALVKSGAPIKRHGERRKYTAALGRSAGCRIRSCIMSKHYAKEVEYHVKI